MTRGGVRTPIVALLVVTLALGAYGAGQWAAAQIGPGDSQDIDTAQNAAEAAATLAAEQAEDAKLPSALRAKEVYRC